MVGFFFLATLSDVVVTDLVVADLAATSFGNLVENQKVRNLVIDIIKKFAVFCSRFPPCAPFLKQLLGFRAFSVILSCFAHSCDDVVNVLRREACAFFLQHTAKFFDSPGQTDYK